LGDDYGKGLPFFAVPDNRGYKVERPMDEDQDQSFRRDRRRHIRFVISLPLAYQWRTTKDTLRTIDISLGGVKIQTDSPIPIDETIDLTILMENEAINPVGRVIWSNLRSDWMFDVGICFESISDQCLDRLEQFLHGTTIEGDRAKRGNSVDQSFLEALDSRPHELNKLRGNFLRWLSKSYPADYKRYAGETVIGVYEIQTFLKNKGIDSLNIYYLIKSLREG
jgi:hypothetical protein